MKLFFIKTYVGVLNQKILIYNVDADNQYSLEETIDCPTCDLEDKVLELLNKVDENQQNYIFTNEKEIEELLTQQHNFSLWED